MPYAFRDFFGRDVSEIRWAEGERWDWSIHHSAAIQLAYSYRTSRSQKACMVRVRIEFELLTGLRTLNDVRYYSYVQLYAFRRKNSWREMSDSLSVVYVRWRKKKIITKRCYCILMCCVALFLTLSLSDIVVGVENIPISTCWTLNLYDNLEHFWQLICVGDLGNLRTCGAGLKLSR